MPQAFAQHWSLDPTVIYLNHGSFGACPTAVLQLQAELRREMESEPVDFLVRRLPGRLDEARIAFAVFVGADPADLVFVPNATTGVNSVLRSLDFAPGDELLTSSHVYAACRKTLDFVASRSGAQVVVADVPFPIESEDQVVAAVLSAVTARTRLALLDHVTSPTALIFPIRRLVEELHARGVDTLVDGAHAPGMVPLDLDNLGGSLLHGERPQVALRPEGRGLPLRPAGPPGRPSSFRHQPRLFIGIPCGIRLDRNLRSDGLALRSRSHPPCGQPASGGLARGDGGQSRPRPTGTVPPVQRLPHRVALPGLDARCHGLASTPKGARRIPCRPPRL